MVNVGITHDYETFTSTRTRLAFLNLRCTLWVPKLKETWQLLNIFIMVCYWNDNIVAVAELMEKFRDFKHKFAGGSMFFFDYDIVCNLGQIHSCRDVGNW